MELLRSDTCLLHKGSITLLFQDKRGGLQVRSPKGTFVNATPIEGTIVVNATTGVELSYIDSGPPPNKTTVPYTTIVAIHGMIFTDRAFQQ